MHLNISWFGPRALFSWPCMGAVWEAQIDWCRNRMLCSSQQTSQRLYLHSSPKLLLFSAHRTDSLAVVFIPCREGRCIKTLRFFPRGASSCGLDPLIKNGKFTAHYPRECSIVKIFPHPGTIVFPHCVDMNGKDICNS